MNTEDETKENEFTLGILSAFIAQDMINNNTNIKTLSISKEIINGTISRFKIIEENSEIMKLEIELLGTKNESKNTANVSREYH